MQATLERAIEQITGESVAVQGSGRTDAGAHALGQVVSFRTDSKLPVQVLQRGFNAVLPFDVAVTSSVEVPLDFNPRHDAESRHYRYRIWNRPVRSPLWHGRAAHIAFPLDAGLMDEAVRTLVGRHNFGAFVPVNYEGSRVREIFSASCSRNGDLIEVAIAGSGFMRQMVRSITGTLIEVGAGRLSVREFGEILASGDRRRAGRTVPASGLYLVRVDYADVNHSVPGSTTRSGEHGTSETPGERT